MKKKSPPQVIARDALPPRPLAPVGAAPVLNESPRRRLILPALALSSLAAGAWLALLASRQEAATSLNHSDRDWVARTRQMIMPIADPPEIAGDVPAAQPTPPAHQKRRRIEIR
jgi:hypothetical protein